MKKKTKKEKSMIKNKKVNFNYFLSRLYKELKTNPELFKICKLTNNVHGDCDYEKIRIDYRKDVYSTLIHEYLHYVYPKLTEDNVLKEECRIINKMSIRQIKNLIKLFAVVI